MLLLRGTSSCIIINIIMIHFVINTGGNTEKLKVEIQISITKILI